MSVDVSESVFTRWKGWTMRHRNEGQFRINWWRHSGYLFIAPQIFGFVAFIAIPIAAVFFFSLHNFNIVNNTFQFIGLDNYSRMLIDRNLGAVTANTIVFSGAFVVLTVVAALGLAVLVDQKLPGMVLFRSLYFVPVVVSISAWTIVWRFLLQPDGGINAALNLFGVDGPNWLRQPPLAMASVILVQLLKSVGFNMIFFLAALQGVPEELKEAAYVDGANARRAFRHITLPLITPVIFLVTTLTMVSALKSFALIFLMTSGGPGLSTTVLAYYIYSVGFKALEQGYASALAVILFIVVLVLTIIQFVIRKRWVFYET